MEDLSTVTPDSIDSSVTFMHVSTRTYKPPLIETEPLVFYPYVSLTVLAMTVGVIGNVSLIVTLLLNRGLQKVGREFMVNMCLADLCVTGLADPLCIVASIKGEQFLSERPILCTAIASLCLTACFCAFLSLSCITLSPMVFICHNGMYSKLFSPGRAIVQCCLCWVVGMGMEVGNFLGWGGHYYDVKNESCIWDRTASFSYTYFVGLVLITGPLLMMLASNAKIFASIGATKSNLMKVQHQASDTGEHSPSVWRETVKACRTLFLQFTVFCVCWLPYTAVILIDVGNELVSPRVHLFVTWLAHLHSAAIVCVYLTNKQIRLAVLRTVSCCCGRFSHVSLQAASNSAAAGTSNVGLSSGSSNVASSAADGKANRI